jgi:hypothetical protein
MIKKVVIGTLVALTLVGARIAIGECTDADWGWHRDAVVINDGSGATDAGQTIVVSDGRGNPGFFPFGLLFLVLVLVLVFSVVRRGRRGGLEGTPLEQQLCRAQRFRTARPKPP